MDMSYFNRLGYKTGDPALNEWIIKGFQSHAGLLVDGVIGPITRSKMNYYNHKNYCPAVFEPIKPYILYKDEDIEKLMRDNLIGLGEAFNHFSMLNDFDVMHNINHAILESGSGTSKIARDKNNLYGWTAYDSSAYDSATGYNSFVDCIEEWSSKYNKLYLEPYGGQYRGNNEYAVNVVYASSPVAGINKSFITQQLRDILAKPIVYLPDDTVPGAPNFTFREGYSNTQINGVRKYKVDPIPDEYIGNAIRVFQNLQLIRSHYNTLVIISFSGNLYRNEPYNIAIGGALKSQHLLANAADVRVVGVSSYEVARWAKENTAFNGFGIINSTWIHLDLRETYWYEEY
jgi:hypothetical protein